MRCRIRAALSSTLPSLTQEHALHFQSATLTIRKWLTLWKNYTNPLLCSKKKKFKNHGVFTRVTASATSAFQDIRVTVDLEGLKKFKVATQKYNSEVFVFY